MSGVSCRRPSSRLLFDRRYGLVFDEWREPSDEALAGGRGMFCIVPLGKALLKVASQSINLAASSTIKVLERPDLLSPQRIQASVNDQLHKVISRLQKPDFSLLALKGSSSLHATRDSTHTPTESGESQMRR